MLFGEDRLFGDAVQLALQSAGFTIARPIRPLEPPDGAVAAVEEERPEIVVIEIDGTPRRLAIGAWIARSFPATKVVALADEEDPDVADSCVRMGFSGYVTKFLSTAQFIRSIETIAEGNLVVPRPPPRNARDLSDGLGLTPREREVLTLLTRGASGTQIAAALDVSEHTVRTHMQNLFSKLGVRSRVQAAAIGVRNGIR
jgi:DNA-binding NarL/FixJ family response regulator